MRDIWFGIIAGIFVCLFWFASLVIAFPRDLDGHFAGSPLKSWFDKLSSGKGLCCSVADGVRVDDPDWDMQGDHYRVKLGGQWVTVPDSALIKEPNKYGPAMVWPYTDPDKKLILNKDGQPDIRCFLPGSGA